MQQKRVGKNVLELVLITLLILPILLFIYFISSGNYYPFYADEAIYLTGGKLFYETGSLKSVLAFDEIRSKLGGFGWYGPMYNILYGIIPFIFGWSFTSNLWVHLILYVVILYILVFSRLFSHVNKSVLLITFLCSYTFIPFLFSYFPELLHVLFGILLYVFFIRADKNPRSFGYFILFVMIFTLFRVTYIFILLALIPLRIEGLSQYKKYLVLVIGIVLGIFYFTFFHAKPSIVGLGDVFEFDMAYVTSVYKTVKTNLHSNILLFFTFFKSWTNGLESILAFIFLGFILLHSIVKSNGTNQRRLIGLLISASTLVMVLLALYSVKTFFIEKQLTWLYTLLLIVVIQEKRYNKILIGVYLIFFLPFMLYKTKDTIDKRMFSYHLTKEQIKTLPDTEVFVSKLESKNEEINILFDNNESPVLNYLAYSFFPISLQGKPILYSTNYRYDHPNEKYKEHGRISIDYILAQEVMYIEGWILKTKLKEGYYLYEKASKPRIP